MMAEGDGEVKKEAVEAGAGGAGGRPTGARKPVGSPAGDPTGEEVAQQGPAAAALPIPISPHTGQVSPGRSRGYMAMRARETTIDPRMPSTMPPPLRLKAR